MNSIKELLNKSFLEKSLAETKNCIWFITDFGIVAKIKNKQIISDFEVEKEALEIGLDLSKEEKEYYEINSARIIIYYS